MSSVDGRALEANLEALYALPLESFVSERKRLADEMKRAGDRAGAAALAKAAKPPVSAWVVNQLARRERDAVERLARASANVREAQLEMVAGKGAAGGSRREAFAEATAAQREGLAALRAAAEKLLEEGGHATTPAVLERVARSLRAMVTSEEAARQIAAGRLSDDVTAGAEGLGDFAALAASLPAGPARPHPPARAPARTEKAEKAEKVDRRAEEKAEQQRKQHAAAERADLLARLRRLVEEAESRARSAAKAAERARRAADAAEAEAKQAEAAAERAEAEAEDARKALKKA